jgi:hypothetical protein
MKDCLEATDCDMLDPPVKVNSLRAILTKVPTQSMVSYVVAVRRTPASRWVGRNILFHQVLKLFCKPTSRQDVSIETETAAGRNACLFR